MGDGSGGGRVWWPPGVSGDGSAECGHDVDAVLAGGVDVAADVEPVLGQHQYKPYSEQADKVRFMVPVIRVDARITMRTRISRWDVCCSYFRS
jgi:hypothetical protein